MGTTSGLGGSPGEQKPFQVISSYGKTPFEAMRALAQGSSREIFWGHNRIVLFSERAARRGVKEVFDVLERKRLIRLIARPAVVQGDIRKLMEADYPLEETGAAGLDKQMASIQLEKSIFNTLLFVDLYSAIEASGMEMFMGKIKVHDDRKEKEGGGGGGGDSGGGGGGDSGSGSGGGSGSGSGPPAEIGGGAIFKGDRMVGWASQRQTEGWLYVQDRGYYFNFIIECPKHEGEYISIEVFEPKSHMIPLCSGRDIRIKLKVTAEGSIENTSCYYEDIMDKQFRLSVERRSARVIRNQISDIIKRSQELETDVCGFGNLIYRKRPHVWEEIGHDWDEIFPHLAVDVDVRFKLIRTGLVDEPLKVGR